MGERFVFEQLRRNEVMLYFKGAFCFMIKPYSLDKCKFLNHYGLPGSFHFDGLIFMLIFNYLEYR